MSKTRARIDIILLLGLHPSLHHTVSLGLLIFEFAAFHRMLVN